MPIDFISIKIPKEKKKRAISFLKGERVIVMESNITIGRFKPGDKPSDAAGIWARKEITLSDIRKRAWPERL